MNLSHALSALAAGAAILTGGAALAHHAVNAQFATERLIEQTGTFVKVDIINPHSYFYFDVAGPGGQVVHWRYEGAGPATLRRMGLSSKAAFTVGGSYRIKSNPSRNGDTVGLLRHLTWPDGRVLDNLNRQIERGQ